MSTFWPSIGLAALILLAVAPGAIGLGVLLADKVHSTSRFALAWFGLALVLAFAYATAITAGAVWLSEQWGIA